MKKRLLAIALALMLTLMLLPTAYAAADDGQSQETIRYTCAKCGKLEDLMIIEYIGRWLSI